MQQPPSDPIDRTTHRNITTKDLLASYALLAAIPATLWAASEPLAAVLALAGIAGAVVATRLARRLAVCIRECRELAVGLPGSARICIGLRDDCCAHVGIAFRDDCCGN